MAYGKIKADTITYDNSGTDVDTTIASLVSKEGTAIESTGESGTDKFLRTDGDGTCSWQLPPVTDISGKADLSGATFTGDVTFTGASYNILWDKSIDALKFSDNAKLMIGAGDDFYITTGGSGAKLHANTGTFELEGDNVQVWNAAANAAMAKFIAGGVVELYHNGTKKIETSAAGIAITGSATISTDLTVTGDLTVSGTTTTVNTATLEVEDKNIELGKVSTPTDTTADGGGITLKGATDKTFNWVDATDAWTSSEHIHLVDSKILKLGTGGDVYFYYDGTSTYLDTYGGDTYIRASASGSGGEENQIIAKTGGGVELYHNNVKKFETTSTGVDIPDTLRLSDSWADNGTQLCLGSDSSGTGCIAAHTTKFNTGANISLSTTLTLDSSQNATFAGTVSDSKGDVRKIPQNPQTSSYTLVASDAGKHILADNTVNLPSSVFAAGDAVTIVNNTSGDISITVAGGSVYNAADASTGNWTLAQRGMVTVLWISATVAHISGAGLS